MYLCVCMNMCAHAHKGQKRVLQPLGLEFQVIVSCQNWVLATELWSSTACHPRAVSVSSYVVVLVNIHSKHNSVSL